ncbi:N-acetylneuraminate synthase family protein [Candidatus Pelagibacter bacterium]|nr:N-acetylneuraminate synthase family protein [Candidatus Pelagibacter bacterium]|tara:strand:+ start:4902 stop:5588 length:687 start_codon:yes stop_codon:yes gene_type:complete
MIFIAEIGLNHNGKFPACQEMIRQAKLSGADIAKFQLGWKSKPNEINFMNLERIKTLKKWADDYEIELMFSIFNYESLELVKELNLKKFKIASRTLIDNFSLVEDIVNLNKKTFISLGMWDKNFLPIKNKDNIDYLWCKSEYPTEKNHLKNFPKNFNDSKLEGYSDHCIGVDMVLLAISRGAKVIEKHFTMDKTSTVIRDHVLSATPEEFKDMVNIGRSINEKINFGI